MVKPRSERAVKLVYDAVSGHQWASRTELPKRLLCWIMCLGSKLYLRYTVLCSLLSPRLADNRWLLVKGDISAKQCKYCYTDWTTLQSRSTWIWVSDPVHIPIFRLPQPPFPCRLIEGDRTRGWDSAISIVNSRIKVILSGHITDFLLSWLCQYNSNSHHNDIHQHLEKWKISVDLMTGYMNYHSQ